MIMQIAAWALTFKIIGFYKERVENKSRGRKCALI